MVYLAYFIVYFAYGLISVLQFLMLLRAVISWFVHDENSRIGMFLYYATEPVIMPVRWIIRKMGIDTDSMFIDISFMITVLLLFVVQILLPTVAV